MENNNTKTLLKKVLLSLMLIAPAMVFGQSISYQWSTGDTTANFQANPTQTTTYYVTVTQYGVSYVDSVTIVVNHPNASADTVVNCNAYTWPVNSQTYTSSGVYLDTLVNAFNCDSVVTLQLTIHNSNTGTDLITACNSYTWPTSGLTYSNSGTYLDTLQNIFGCDSVVTLNLTINNSNTGTDVITACDSYTWIDGNTYTASNNIATHTLQNVNGCDSVVTLNLTINQSTASADTALGVGKYIWPLNGDTLTTSGQYLDTIANAKGCDSVITLELTIVPPLIVNAGVSDSIICEGGAVTVGVSVNTQMTPQYSPGTVHCNGTPTVVVDVTNPITGKTWMDRNLGASRAAQSSTDSLAYGDLYQWGRGADGHQCRNSATTSLKSSTDQPGHGNFITEINSPIDWRSPQNTNLWQGVNGVNNPCPSGYRLPTETELNAERLSWSSNNSAGAFASPLKLPMAGYRSSTGQLFWFGTGASYWTSTGSGNGRRSSQLGFNSSVANMSTTSFRAYGYSIRCIKD